MDSVGVALIKSHMPSSKQHGCIAASSNTRCRSMLGGKNGPTMLRIDIIAESLKKDIFASV